MNNKHRHTLEAIFEKPIRSNLKWKDIESLFKHLKANITKGGGSFVAVELNGARSVFHRPHPRPDTDKGAVVAVRDFLENAGIKP